MDQETKAYIDDQTIIVLVGLLLLAGVLSNMATRINGSGHAGIDPDVTKPVSVTVAAGITIPAGTYRVYSAMSGPGSSVATLFDGTENAANNFWGLIGPGTYAMGGAATLYPVGYGQLAPESSPIVGEGYAKSDGTIVSTLSAAASINGWALQVCQCADKYRVVKGLVEQREV